jgi:hypothetical protein
MAWVSAMPAVAHVVSRIAIPENGTAMTTSRLDRMETRVRVPVEGEGGINMPASMELVDQLGQNVVLQS